jgi:hypothetical protein
MKDIMTRDDIFPSLLVAYGNSRGTAPSLRDGVPSEARGGVHAELHHRLFTQGGLTALMRSMRGVSSAAASTKPSRSALGQVSLGSAPGTLKMLETRHTEFQHKSRQH